MDLRANTGGTVKVGPILNKEGKALNSKKLWPKQVFLSENEGPLMPMMDKTLMPVDIDGYFDIPLPSLQPGSLQIIVAVEGYVTSHYERTVLSERAYGEKYGNDILKVEATNVPISDKGYVHTDPNMIVGIDLARVLHQDSRLNLQNTFIGQVGTVASPHKTDMEPLVKLVNKLQETVQVSHQLACDKIDKFQTTSSEIDTLRTQMLAMVLGLKEVFDEVQKRQLKAETVGDMLKDELVPLAKGIDVAKLSELVINICTAIGQLEILTVKQITGGGPLDTKDGKVRLADGDIKLEDGKVFAKDVEQKGGYSLGKDGIGGIEASLARVIREEMKKVSEKVDKIEGKVTKRIGRAHH